MKAKRKPFLYPSSAECYTDSAALELEIQSMKFSILKNEVLKVHNHKITPPTEKYAAYKTRVDGGIQIVRASEEDFFKTLHEFYFGSKIKAPTLEEAINQWISSREESGVIEYQTALHYLDDAKKYIFIYEIASKDITQITKAQLYNYFEHLVSDGSKISKKTLSNVKTVINGAFDFANMQDGIDCIDARRINVRDLKIKCFEKDNSEETYTREEAELIIQNLSGLSNPDVYDYAIQFFFCICTRISELRALTWETDIDMERRIIHLQHQMVTKKLDGYNRKTVDVGYMKSHSSAGKRDIEMSEYAAYILNEVYKITGNKKYVFQSKGQNPISINNFNERLKEVCERLGIRYKSSHKIRFYACTRMYEYELPEKAIQYRMGHSGVEMTRKYYRGKNQKLDSEVVNEMFSFPLPALSNEV